MVIFTETIQTVNAAKLILHPRHGLSHHRESGIGRRRRPSRGPESRDVQAVHGGARARGGADRGDGGHGRGGAHDRGAHSDAALRAVADGARDEEEPGVDAGGGYAGRLHPLRRQLRQQVVSPEGRPPAGQAVRRPDRHQYIHAVSIAIGIFYCIFVNSLL